MLGLEAKLSKDWEGKSAQDIAASAFQLTNDSGCPGATWPLTTTNSCVTARCVTGTPANAGTAMALVTPGTTVTGMPASAHAITSS